MSSNIISISPKKSVSPSDNVAPGKDIEERSGTFDDIKDPVVTIFQKDLDNKIENDNTKKYQFQGQSKRLTRWFHLDHEWL